MTAKEVILENRIKLEKLEKLYPTKYCCLWNGVNSFFKYTLSRYKLNHNEEPLFFVWGNSSKLFITSQRLHFNKSNRDTVFNLQDTYIIEGGFGIVIQEKKDTCIKQSALLPNDLLSSYDANFWINLLSKMADSARRSMPCESNFNFSTSKKQNSYTVTVKSESVQKNRVSIEKRSISQHSRNDYSNEKLVTKNDIDNAYNQLTEIINDAYTDISRLKGVNHKFDDIQQKMSQVLETKVQDAKDMLSQTKKKTVWDNLVIAFFGETNAGKSTIIETFRILFDPNRKKEDGLIVGDGQHDFTKTYNEYKLSISGKPFTLIDVPGIEGKEEDFRDSIKTALQKAHIVFYVNGHNKKPDEATAKKIKNYLGDWVKVYSIYNVRGSVSNYDEEEERETLFTDGVRKNESLIRAEFKRILGDVYVGNLTIQAQLAMCAKASFSAKREDLIRYQQKLLRYFANSPEKVLQFSQFQTIVNLVDEKSVNFKQEIIEANKQKLISLASRIADDISNTMASQKSYVERLKTNLNVAEREICNNLLNNAQHNISSSIKNMIDSSFGDLKSYAFSCIDKGDSNLVRDVEAYQRRRFSKLRNDIAVCVKEDLRKIEQTSNRKLRELDGVNIKPLSFNDYIDFDAEIDFSNAFDSLDIDFEDVVNWTGKTAGTAATGALIGSIIPGLGTVIGAAIGGVVGGVIHAASGDGGKADARKSVSDAINKAKAKANRDISNSLAPVFENLRRVSKDLKNAIQTEKRNINTLQDAIDDFDIDINRYVSQLKQQRYGRI